MFVGVSGEGGGAFDEGASEGVFAGVAGPVSGRAEFRGEPDARAERTRAPVPGTSRGLALRAQHPCQQPVYVPPVRRRPGLVRGDPRPRVAEHDATGRPLSDAGRLSGVQAPGVEPPRSDRAEERVSGDRVLVRRREQQKQTRVVGQRPDLPAAPGEQLRCQGSRFGRQGVETRGLTWGQPREEFGDCARIAVDRAQYSDTDPFGERGVEGPPCVGAARWRSAV
ncbi:hypothetical protein ACFWOB_19900 [Streptomyces sp. NPDC058420]|uniref:hypothetical protein n=1 Tax=Streptomyces sp. NPDC058420 TaxID=3346489 RepID=UPI0036553C33